MRTIYLTSHLLILSSFKVHLVDFPQTNSIIHLVTFFIWLSFMINLEYNEGNIEEMQMIDEVEGVGNS